MELLLLNNNSKMYQWVKDLFPINRSLIGKKVLNY